MAAIKGPAVFLVGFCATYRHFADLGLCRCADSRLGSTRHGYRPSRDLEHTDDPITSICADKSTFLPDRQLDEDVNALLRLKGGGKGVLAISQVATGEENGLTLRVYASDGAIKMEPGESELS